MKLCRFYFSWSLIPAIFVLFLTNAFEVAALNDVFEKILRNIPDIYVVILLRDKLKLFCFEAQSFHKEKFKETMFQ